MTVKRTHVNGYFITSGLRPNGHYVMICPRGGLRSHEVSTNLKTTTGQQTQQAVTYNGCRGPTPIHFCRLCVVCGAVIGVSHARARRFDNGFVDYNTGGKEPSKISSAKAPFYTLRRLNGRASRKRSKLHLEEALIPACREMEKTILSSLRLCQCSYEHRNCPRIPQMSTGVTHPGRRHELQESSMG